MGQHYQGSCSQGSCGCSQSSHGSQPSKNGCGCGCHNCNCCDQQHGKYADELLHLADEAWMCLLKEKIKEEIRLNAGEQLTQLAKLVSSANQARWKDKMQSKKDYESFECELKNLLCCKHQK